MKFYTSYFYQVRFFKPNMIPISTAKWQPRWYGTTPYVDKNGVMNGLCAAPFVLPESHWNEMVKEGMECCKPCPQSAPNCAFMKDYRHYLTTLDFDSIKHRCESLALRAQEQLGFKEEPEVVLLVHEPKSCDCAERPVIQQWFREHGVPIEEWNKPWWPNG